MKTKQILIVFLLGVLLSPLVWGGDKEGNGGDRVEVLFLNAHQKASTLIQSLTTENIENLNIPLFFKNWLKAEQDGTAHFILLQFHTETMQLRFQEEACNEEGYPRATSYDNSDPLHP